MGGKVDRCSKTREAGRAQSVDEVVGRICPAKSSVGGAAPASR